MQRLINDLLAFSRVGRTTSGFRHVDLREIALAAAAQVEMTRAELDGEIVLGDLPRVQGDPALLRQLLLNLFGNGLKFHRPGTAPVVRVTRTRTASTGVRPSRTTASASSPSTPRRSSSSSSGCTARVYAGTGIGLALVKKIASSTEVGMAGPPTPRNEPGTVIRFTLPVDAVGPTHRSCRRDPARGFAASTSCWSKDDPGDVLMTREAFEDTCTTGWTSSRRRGGDEST
jgi:signal transduction histidine kinase